MATDKSKLIDLDECVVKTLDLFIEKGNPDLNIPKFKRPLVVGSGNAAVTGQIIMKDSDAVFADESNFKNVLNVIKNVDGAILISSSGGKHAPIIAKELKRRKIKTILLTNNPKAAAAKYADKVYVFDKNAEPYTYNTSTYAGIILGKTKESAKEILKRIKKMKVPKNLKKYDAYYFIIPKRFYLIKEMILTKFDELFGPKISARVFTEEQTKHAKTIIPYDRELFIGLGCKNNLFGENRLDIPLSRDADYGEIMLVSYYFIGCIQKQNPHYFKDNIERYTKEASKLFGEEINPMVE